MLQTSNLAVLLNYACAFSFLVFTKFQDLNVRMGRPRDQVLQRRPTRRLLIILIPLYIIVIIMFCWSDNTKSPQNLKTPKKTNNYNVFKERKSLHAPTLATSFFFQILSYVAPSSGWGIRGALFSLISSTASTWRIKVKQIYISVL